MKTLRPALVLLALVACAPPKKVEAPKPTPVAPTVTCDILSGATDVLPGLATIVLTASEAIDPASVNATNITLSANTVEEIGFGVSEDGLTITLTMPAAGLSEHAHYTLFVSGLQATTALGGLKLKAPLQVRFATVGGPPTLRATDPHDMVNGVAVTIHPTLTFTESVVDSAPSAIQLKHGTDVVDADVSFDANGKVATIIPVGMLLGGATYTVEIGAGVKDADDSLPLAGAPKTVLTFTTESIPPVVRQVVPADSTSALPLNSQFVITFSRRMNPDTINSSTIVLTGIALDSTMTTVPTTITLGSNNSIATVAPTSMLSLGMTYLLVVSTAVKDYSNIALLDPYTFHYSTSLPSPVVTAIDPADNVMDAPIDGVVRATFNVPMTASTFPGHFKVTETDTGNELLGLDPIVTPTGFSAQFIPSPAPFKPLTNYTVTLTADIHDTRSQPLAAFTSHFKTQQEPAPFVTGFACQGVLDPTMCPTQTRIQISFSRVVMGVDGTTVTVSKAGTPVAGTVTANPNSAEFAPASPFDANTTYDLTITSAITNSAGVALVPYTGQFSTGAM